MRTIKHIVLHCTGTQPNVSVNAIQRYWKQKLGWKNAGYHFIIDTDGHVTQLQPLDKPSNGVRGHNAHSIHISYIGGIDSSGRSKDTRTSAQYTAMAALVKSLYAVFSKSNSRLEVKGHRDFPNVKKSCPSFEVKDYLNEIKLWN